MKYLIEVRLPAGDLTYDMFVSASMQIGTITQLASQAFTMLSSGVYQGNENTLLCEQTTGQIYDCNKRVCETNIKNGTKVFIL